MNLKISNNKSTNHSLGEPPGLCRRKEETVTVLPNRNKSHKSALSEQVFGYILLLFLTFVQDNLEETRIIIAEIVRLYYIHKIFLCKNIDKHRGGFLCQQQEVVMPAVYSDHVVTLS